MTIRDGGQKSALLPSVKSKFVGETLDTSLEVSLTCLQLIHLSSTASTDLSTSQNGQRHGQNRSHLHDGSMVQTELQERCV